MQKSTTAFLAFIVAVMLTVSAGAQTWYWTKQADSSTSQNASQVAVDRNNNPYYTGYYNGSRIAFGNIGLTNTCTQSDFLVKYTTNGVPVWARNASALDPNARVFGMTVATDRSNNVVEAGYFSDSIAFGPYHMYAQNTSMYTVKYNSLGTLLWATSAPSSAQCFNEGYATGSDFNNHTLVTGYFQDTVKFGATTLSAPSGTNDMFLVKYDHNGNVIWARAPVLKNSQSFVQGVNMAVDDSGNTFVSGGIRDTVTFGAIKVGTPIGATYSYVAKYDTGGNVKWVIDIPANWAGGIPVPLAIDKTGNVYVSVAFNNFSLTIGSYTVTDGNHQGCGNILLAKYDRNGNPTWAICAAYISDPEVCVIAESSLATDRCNNVYWSGVCSDTFKVANVAVTVPGAATHQNRPFSFIMQLDSNANPIAAAAIANQSDVYFSNYLAVDSLSKAYFVGDLYDPATVVIGSDTVYRYQNNPTCYMSKFAVVPAIVNNNNNSDSICKGDSITLKISPIPGYTVVWNNGKTTDSITVKPNTTTTYFAAFDNGCIMDTSFIKIYVTTGFASIASVPASDSICSGDSITLTGSGGGNYLWSNGKTSSTIKVAPLLNITYTLSVTKGGCHDSASVNVVVSPVPIAGITVTPSNDTICLGDSAMLVGGGGGKYFWTNTSQNKDTIWVKPIATTVYTVQVSKAGCTSNATQKIVVINRAAQGIVLAKDSICPSDSTTMTAFGGSKYKWLPPVKPANSGNATVYVKAAATTAFSVVIYTPCGNDTLVKTLHVATGPVISVSGTPKECLGYTTTLNASGGSSYTWLPAGGLSCNNCPNPIITLANTTSYTLAVSNGTCISDTIITVTVQQPPLINIIANPANVCFGSSTVISATGGGTYVWSNGSTTSSITVSPGHDITYSVVVNNGCIDSNRVGIVVDSIYFRACCDSCIIKGNTVDLGAYGVGQDYAWTPAAGLSCDNCPYPLATPMVTTTYTVTSVDNKGCHTSRTITICLECLDFTVPNIFTPNNDGINDDFVVKLNNYTTYSISIYDRWGKVMYKSNDPSVYWTGRLQGTDYMVPDGTYFYVIDATCDANTYKKKGFVQVVAGGGK